MRQLRRQPPVPSPEIDDEIILRDSSRSNDLGRKRARPQKVLATSERRPARR
jgi:hypothetical protein